MNQRERVQLACDFHALALKTRCGDWDKDGDEGEMDVAKMAKPIPPARWGKAFSLARDIDDSVSGLPRPEPGADPAGFVWLTWEREKNRFSLGLKSSGFTWEQHTSEAHRIGEATTLGDAFDVLKATFK